MDAWGMDELLHLPPSGWIGFTMTMLLAEETGQWPLVLKFISLSAIGKGTDIKSPKDTRCIGVSSCVYSVWSGLRFRHLIPWMLRVFPSNIIGGVPERHMFESEAQLSLDIRDFQTEPLLVLLDRVKCFDRIVPAVAVSALNSLGLPPPIGVAIQGFYSNQVRIMKLGKAFGKRLIHGSSALQGCTLSILMVNSIFSVLMAHLNKICPQIQATTFIDDIKIWAKRENIGMLQSALAETVEFDRLTGQLISEEKTTVVSRREKQRRFLIQVGRTYKSKSNAKSLRNVHRADKKRQLWHKIRGQTKQQLLCGKLRNFLFATPKKLYTSKPMPAPNGCTALNSKFRQSEPSLALGHMFFFPNRLKRIRSPWLFNMRPSLLTLVLL